MHSIGFTEKPPSYKSFKAEKFHKALERTRALVKSVHESSLKDEDKRKLLKEMREIIQ
jgi:DNA-binding transcriptional regulator GbsR (MarR family)